MAIDASCNSEHWNSPYSGSFLAFSEYSLFRVYPFISSAPGWPNHLRAPSLAPSTFIKLAHSIDLRRRLRNWLRHVFWSLYLGRDCRCWIFSAFQSCFELIRNHCNLKCHQSYLQRHLSFYSLLHSDCIQKLGFLADIGDFKVCSAHLRGRRFCILYQRHAGRLHQS